MRVTNLRASSINNYKLCEWDYFLKYICNYQTPSGKKTVCGSIIHYSLELVAKFKMDGNTDIPNPEFFFESAWQKYYTEENHIYNFTEKDKEFCRNSFYKVYNSSLNPLNDKILDIEKQFEIEIQKPGFKLPNGKYMLLRGTVDLVTEIDSETLWIKDYKSGSRKDYIEGHYKDVDTLQWDTQLRVYNLALSKIYPKYKYRVFTLVYINDGGPFSVSFESKDLETTLDNLRRTFNEIKNNNEPKRLKDDITRRDELWKCKNVCYFGKQKNENGQSLCDEYYNIYKDYGIEKATEIITNISIEGKQLNISDRNDYSHDRMYRGIIK